MNSDDTELGRAIERARHLRIAYEHVREDPGADSAHLAALHDEISAAEDAIAHLRDQDNDAGKGVSS
jgi:hypothetical protein